MIGLSRKNTLVMSITPSLAEIRAATIFVGAMKPSWSFFDRYWMTSPNEFVVNLLFVDFIANKSQNQPQSQSHPPQIQGGYVSSRCGR